MDRQLAYDTGPEPEDGEESTEDRAEGRSFVDVPWKVGLAAGAGTFVAVYAIAYQFASAITATGGTGSAEPSTRILAALLMLASHGATIESDGGPLGVGSLFGIMAPLATLAVVPVLVAAGYLLVRYVAEDEFEGTVRTAARAGGAFAAGYVVLSALLARLSRWTPMDERNGDDPAPGGPGANDPETLAVAVDSSLVITVGGTVVAFLALGGLLALYATFGDRPSDDGDSGDGDGPNEEQVAESDGRAANEPGGGSANEPDERAADEDGGPADRRPSSAPDYPPRRSVDPDRGSDDPDRRYGNTGGRGDDAARRDGSTDGRDAGPDERYGADRRK